jgi:hypothetical protein
MLMRKQTYRLKEIVYTIAYMVLASGQRVDDEGEDLVHGLPIRPRLHPLEPEVHDLALPSAVGRGRASVAMSATWNGRRLTHPRSRGRGGRVPGSTARRPPAAEDTGRLGAPAGAPSQRG